MKRRAIINKPETWGKHAVIVDAWGNICDKVEDGLEKIKQMFKFNPENSIICYLNRGYRDKPKKI